MNRPRKVRVVCVALTFGLILQSCAAVDQFGSRVEDANRNSQRANDEETLLNIVRAKYYRPLTFVAVSQITGSQTETITSGLPTITFGSGITAAQHIGQITNSVMGQAQGSYQSNPLVSTQFQTGMLAAIPESTIAYLIAAHPRDPVLFSTIDALIIKVKSTGKYYRLDNNPDEDRENGNCSSVWTKPFDAHFFNQAIPCSYSTFLFVANFIVGSGLTAEIIPSGGGKKGDAGSESNTKKASGTGAAGDKTPANTKGTSSTASADKAATSPQGRFCFDPTKSGRGMRAPLCSMFKQAVGSATKKSSSIKFDFGSVGTIEAQILIKSPLGVYELFGASLRHPWANNFPFPYAARQGIDLIKQEPFVNVASSSEPCFAKVIYQEEQYCVPKSSQNTPIIFDIAQQLKNLSTTPTDLNAPFAVRFVGN